MTITSDPQYPVPGDTVTLSCSGLTGSSAATRYELTSVPNRSALSTGILTDPAGAPVQYFVPDAAGEYGLVAYDFRRSSGRGGAFSGDPVSEARDVLLSTQTGTVSVADEMLLPIAGAGHSLTLRCLTAGGVIAEASLVNPTTEKARQCALDIAVLAAVAALEGEDADAAGEDFVDGVVDFVAKFNAHLETTGSVHIKADTVNPIEPSLVDTIVGATYALSELEDHFIGHLTTDDDGDPWHGTFDHTNYSITAKSPGLAGGTVKLADMRRVYTNHLATIADDVHDSADVVNTLTAPSLLSSAIIAVLNFFASREPATPDGESDATLQVASLYGFGAG